MNPKIEETMCVRQTRAGRPGARQRIPEQLLAAVAMMLVPGAVPIPKAKGSEPRRSATFANRV